ncbi:MAG: cobalamin biosynthesis protein [Candidatus Methanomethylophilaceae archaeon]|nr:cobalamin biosynthesis protein [Candidatus Methanomethylophilaceae archaeon]
MMKVRIIAFSARGCGIAELVSRVLFAEECEVFAKTNSAPEGFRDAEKLDVWAEESMRSCDAIVFVGAAGIAVRAIAPYVKDKKTDPAVVCVDDIGRFAISLLSGHIGGANRLTERIAAGIGATPVITTATDIHGRFAVDVFSTDNNMVFRGTKVAKDVSAWILDGKDVGFLSEYPYTGSMPPELKERSSGEIGITVSAKASPPRRFDETLVLIPKIHVFGIGCKRGATYEAVRSLFDEVLKSADIDVKSVRAIASIDLKEDEEAIKQLSAATGIPTVFFTSEELNDQPDIGFSKSDFVKSVTDVDCVCERAAMKASLNGRLVRGKVASNGVTAAVAQDSFTIKFGGSVQ